jgi:MSHA biogenesis protein MshP
MTHKSIVRYQQQGFGAFMAIAVVVILASLAAAASSLWATQQLSSAQDILSAKAWQAAKAGNEYGLYQALKNSNPTCSLPLNRYKEITFPLDLRADTGFYVTVTSSCTAYYEGELTPGSPQTVRVYEIKAVACPASTCPSSDPAVVATPGYVERTRLVQATN